jgi:hypothetical protein
MMRADLDLNGDGWSRRLISVCGDDSRVPEIARYY